MKGPHPGPSLKGREVTGGWFERCNSRVIALAEAGEVGSDALEGGFGFFFVEFEVAGLTADDIKREPGACFGFGGRRLRRASERVICWRKSRVRGLVSGNVFEYHQAPEILFVRSEVVNHRLPGPGFGKPSVPVFQLRWKQAVSKNVLANVLDKHYMG